MIRCRAVLFTITSSAGGIDASQVAILEMAAGTWRTLVRGASQAQYVSSGHLVYVAGGALWAVAFDLANLQTKGTASPVVSHVVTLPTATAEFDVARNGTLAYVIGGTEAAPRTLVWVDRHGQEEVIAAPARPYVATRLSPDGRHVALEIEDQDHDIWVWDLTRKTLTRVTTDPGSDRSPVWMPDGHRLLFSSQAGSVLGSLFWHAADGTGTAERLLIDSPNVQRPSSVVADGTRVLFMEGADLMMLTLGNDRRVRPVIQTAQIEQNGAISPDNRWLAYDSNDSGPSQIYVRPFPNANESKAQVSTGEARSRSGVGTVASSSTWRPMARSSVCRWSLGGNGSRVCRPRYSSARTLAESATVALARTMCRRTACVSSCSNR